MTPGDERHLTVALTGVGEAGIALANTVVGDLRQVFALSRQVRVELLADARAGEQEPDLWMMFAGGAMFGAPANGAGSVSGPLPPPSGAYSVRLGWVLPQDGASGIAAANWLREQGFAVFDHYDPPDPARLVRMAVVSIVAPVAEGMTCLDLFDFHRALMRSQTAGGGVSLFPLSTRDIDLDRQIATDRRLAPGGAMSGVIGGPDLTMEQVGSWGDFASGLSDEIRSISVVSAPWLLGSEDNALVVIWQSEAGRLRPSSEAADWSGLGSVTYRLGLWRRSL